MVTIKISPSYSLQENDIHQRIERVSEDLNEIKIFYSIGISPKRKQRLEEFLTSELDALQHLPFDLYDQQSKVDYLLLQNFLERQLRELDLENKQDKKAAPLLKFTTPLVVLCEARASLKPIEPKEMAQMLFETHSQLTSLIRSINDNSSEFNIEKASSFRAANTINSFQDHLTEWFNFYKGYDPLFTWWVDQPYKAVQSNLVAASETILHVLVGIQKDDTDAIVGQPIGHGGLLNELEAEMIPYTPEEILSIGEREFEWCITEMKKASISLGYEDWRQGLEQVKNDFVEPGKQTQLVRDLAEEAIDFVEKYELVTVPEIAKETWQTFMMSAERQKVNPFFLGGDCIIISYPTCDMDHEAKMMSMRGNNVHFSRATVFHEMIPGHHLQLHMNARHRSYRRLFDTPFWIEGWSLYWEFLLWDDNRWTKTQQNRIGMLFWRLHRCARIIFSIKFHLGQMSPQECIELLVTQVGHERATAEGEVRRSLNGDYSPLYQAGYMLGALQIRALRQEILASGLMREREFHDRFLVENRMPIELLRALIENRALTRDYKPSWRFHPIMNEAGIFGV